MCGHVVCTWPLITEFDGSNERVFCDECARLKYGVDVHDQFILVKLAPPPKKKRTTVPKEKPAKAPKPKSPFLQLLEQEGLF